MIPALVLSRKRDKQELKTEEIRFLIKGYVDGSIPDFQMSAWAMAVYLNGMTDRETADLTDCMLESGDRLRRAGQQPRVDKHSTGGLGDKVSLVLAPLLAEFDLHVPMISGRALGVTGGTLDKLEAIPGYRCDLSEDEIEKQLRALGCVITGATQNLVPADRKLYQLRDVTATVPSIPLITASIMSKKLAASLDALVLDVKWGSGAFMQTRERAIQLAHSLVATGQRMGVPTEALLTDMNQPLGRMVGNACEVNESIDLLQGHGPDDAREVTLALAVPLLLRTGRAANAKLARDALSEKLSSGAAWERFQAMVRSQGGRLDGKLPLATPRDILAERSGFVGRCDGQALGYSVIELGGGRKVGGEPLDHLVGLEMLVRIGDAVEKGDALARVFARSREAFDAFQPMILSAIPITDQPLSPPVLIEHLES